MSCKFSLDRKRLDLNRRDRDGKDSTLLSLYNKFFRPREADRKGPPPEVFLEDYKFGFDLVDLHFQSSLLIAFVMASRFAL